MGTDESIDPKEIVREARKILLIDWPNADVPRLLVEEGFTVFCYSPGRYSRAEIEKDQLVFRPLDDTPGSVDIVSVYRPEQEHEDIITNHALPLKAKILWLHPPVTSQKTRALADKYGLSFLEDISIIEVAGK